MQKQSRTIPVTAILALALLAGTAFARLEESPEQCATRYGKPLRETADGETVVREYKKSGIDVLIRFMTKKEKLFAFNQAVLIAYAKSSPSEGRNQPLSKAEIGKLLDVNSQGQQWQEIDLVKKAAGLKPGPEQTRLIQDAGVFTLWTRQSGATAQYFKKTHKLVIRVSPDVALPKRGEPPLLEGF